MAALALILHVPSSMDDELTPLRLPGGTWGALRATLGSWWGNLFVLTGLNIVWVVALFTVVAAPPATAAMFYVARRVLEHDPFLGRESFMAPARRYFWASWRWALAVVAVAGLTATNLWFYQEVPGLLWSLLRWLWATILVVWGTINLFFWPIWFAEEPSYRTLRITWRNALAFVASKPLATLIAFALTGLLATASGLTGILLGVLFMAWTALLATSILAAHLPPVEGGAGVEETGEEG